MLIRWSTGVFTMLAQMGSLLVLSLVFLNAFFSGVCGQRLLFGQGAPSCFTQIDDLRGQICSRHNEDSKYVRIKTYNGKYLWAEPTTSTSSKYVRTRCCEVKDVAGRVDVRVPGRRTTFKVHCGTLEGLRTVRFEVLKSDANEPSGYYLYASSSRKGLPMYVIKNPSSNIAGINFVLERWMAGSKIGIRTLSRNTWLSFYDDGDGDIDVKSYTVSQFPIPYVGERFSLEIVPKGCVEIQTNEFIKAAPDGTSPEDCENLPDRCFWSFGWDYRRGKMLRGYCYYRKGSQCFRLGKRYEVVKYKNQPRECESFNFCYDYHAKYCYLGEEVKE